jgi:hypothetical protein
MKKSKKVSLIHYSHPVIRVKLKKNDQKHQIVEIRPFKPVNVVIRPGDTLSLNYNILIEFPETL